MDTISFTYYHFPIITREEARAALPQHPYSFFDEGYREWLDTFISKASVFYHVQEVNHGELVWRAFCRAHGIPTDDSASRYGLYDEWEAELEYQGVNAHILDHRAAMSRLNAYRESLYGKRDLWHSSVEGIEQFLKSLHEVTPDVLRPDIDAFWFNRCVTNNDARTAVDLRDMPYSEYLKSTHWRRVRAAMLLIHRARCNNMRCIGSEEGAWMGDEKFVRVHHMNYRYRGCERLQDLRLLCDTCHEQLHKRKDFVLDLDAFWTIP